MKILAIESSGTVASAGLWEDGTVLFEKTGPFKVTHSETLMPLISDVFEECAVSPADVDYIAVSGGPGSFTGLRIGSASAKGLGFALGKDLIHVPTLDAMAYNLQGEDALIVPLMDARRGQVYTGIYRFENDKLVTLKGASAVSLESLIDEINADFSREKVIFLGDAVALSTVKVPANASDTQASVPAARALIEERCKAEYAFAPEEKMLQSAGSVARLGAVLAGEGRTVSADFEAPEYLRPSQAERVRAEQEETR